MRVIASAAGPQKSAGPLRSPRSSQSECADRLHDQDVVRVDRHPRLDVRQRQR